MNSGLSGFWNWLMSIIRCTRFVDPSSLAYLPAAWQPDYDDDVRPLTCFTYSNCRSSAA